MKRVIYLASVAALIGFSSCGSEAKAPVEDVPISTDIINVPSEADDNKPLAAFEFENIVTLKFHDRFYALVRFWKHIGYKNIAESIIVDIRNVNSHSGKAEMIGPLFYFFPERSVLIVYI